MEKVKSASFNIIGIAVRTTNENNQSANDISALWHKFMTENVLSKIPNKVDDTVYCLYTNYEGDYTQAYTSIIGCKAESLDAIPEGMVGQAFDGGNYQKMSVRGNLAEDLVINQWVKIWGMSDLDRAYTVDFEVYGGKAQNPSDAEIDIFVAIK